MTTGAGARATTSPASPDPRAGNPPEEAAGAAAGDAWTEERKGARDERLRATREGIAPNLISDGRRRRTERSEGSSNRDGSCRLRLLVAYDGAPYSGFARQPGRRTVQGQLEEALTRLAKQPVTTVGAGRTDRGVHAYGQVVHADVPAHLEPGRVRAALNGVLGPSIVVRAAGWAPPGFDARFSARRRTYLYRIDDSPAPDPLTRGWVLHWRRPVSVERMAEAAAPLLGEHDFASFCRARGGATTRRRLRGIDVHRLPGAPASAHGAPPGLGPAHGHLVVVRVTADAFCHQMVRSVVGFLLDTGDGRRDPASAAAVLAARDRGVVGTIAPPHGLVLESVTYDQVWPDGELPHQRQDR